MSEQFTNHLINEESPYLQQHAHNPLDWYPWGEEAFNKAKDENKLIFLSIGYSTCHWCHVMEHESFENETIAKEINKNFVSIKIDREEMPHIDKYYQDLYFLLNKRGGGWPLSVVMTPDLKPFFAATYIPSTPKRGHATIIQVFAMLHDAYTNKLDEVLKSADSIERAMKNTARNKITKSVVLDNNVLEKFRQTVIKEHDTIYGGFGRAPKFPHASLLETILDVYVITQEKELLSIALHALDTMSRGGIYDQIEGGFYRYSVDAEWLIPHFEKMLYTNAELLSAYSKAYAITGKKRYKKIVDEIVAFSKIRFLSDGLLFSASDADSDGEEGKYFVFSYEDTLKDLINNGIKHSDAINILEYYDIEESGNFESEKSNPQIMEDVDIDTKLIKKSKSILLKNRAKKNYPFIDTKTLTSWNAIFISALFEAKERVYAQDILDSLINELFVNGILYHQKLPNIKPSKVALFEDYSFLITSLLDAYKSSMDDSYLIKAQEFQNKAIEMFYEDGIWYLSNDDFKTVAGVEDNAYKSALSNMITNLYFLAVISDSLEYKSVADRSLDSVSKAISAHPFAYPWALRAFLLKEHGAVVIKTDDPIKAKEIFDDSYPFFIYKRWDKKTHQACKLELCFAYDETLEKLYEKVSKGIK